MKDTEFDYLSNNYKKTLKHSFPKLLEDVDYFSSYKIKLIHKLTIIKKNLNILDFGCGPGISLQLIDKYFRNCKLWGYDISKEFLKKIKKKKNSFILTNNLNKIPKKKFDIIVISNVLHHIKKSKHHLILSNCKNFLNNSGIIYIFEHNPNNPFTRYIFKNALIDKNATMISSSELICKSLKAKLKILSLKYTLFFPKQLYFFRFLEKYLHWFPLGAQYLLILKK